MLGTEAELRGIGATAGPDGAVVEEEERVVLAARDGDDLGAVVERRVERVNKGRDLDDVLAAATVLADTSLMERVEAPGVDAAVLVDSKRVVVTGADSDNVAQGEPLRRQAVELAPLDNTPAELILLAVAPDKDGSIDRQGEDVVRAAGDRSEPMLGERRQRDRLKLSLRRVGRAVKAQETLCRLGFTWRIVSSALLPRAISTASNDVHGTIPKL